MIKINKNNQLREKFIRKLLGLVYRLDNSGNAVFEQNGEQNFIHQVADFYPDNFTLFDIGANRGEYTAMAISRRNSRPDDHFHLFEPQKSCFAELQSKFQTNKSVQLNNVGVSDTAGESIIYKDTEGSGLSSLYRRNLDYYSLALSQEEPLRLIRVEDYIRDNGIKKINLVKIDIEGHELPALRGFGEYLEPTFIDFIQFEYGGANLDSHTNLLDFYNLLEPRGFTLCKIMPSCLEKRKYNPRYDNFVNQNFVAVGRNTGLNLVL